MSDINWKSKYESIKAKWMETVDAAFRLGYEQGAKEAQVDAVQQQQQQEADQMAAQANGMGDPNQDPNADDPNQDPNAGPEVEGPPVSANPQGSELDKHINELESMLQKSEGEVYLPSILASLDKLKRAQKAIAFTNELRKSAQAIPAIAKALHKPAFRLSQNANHNLSSAAKKAVSMQETIVKDIMKSWDEESKKASTDILTQIKAEVATKKE